VKIHYFKKREPRVGYDPRGRDTGRVTLELERPTIPEIPIDEPEEEAEDEPVRAKALPPPEPAPKSKGRGGSAASEPDGPSRRKSRGSSRRAASEDEAPPEGSLAERLSTARKFVSEGRLGEARAILERLVKMGVASGPVHSELGAIYMAQGVTDRALERFDDALNLEPMDLFARVCRGEARLGRGELRMAREDLQRVLDMGTAGSPLVERAQQLLQRVNEQGDRKRQ
jgi:predicted Zn-dependent protease